jgi:ribonuclease BN (tRNA processing enzyme)
MNLTVLGCYGPYPHVSGACSGYLLTAGPHTFILDLGNGTLRNYFRHQTLQNLDAIFLSHLHADHISDLFVLRYALDAQGLSKDIYLPADPTEEYKRIPYKAVYQPHEISPQTEVHFGDVTVTFCPMRHAVPSYAIKITNGRQSFVYSGDTGANDALTEFSRGCDLLLCESAILDQDNDRMEFHMSAKQACETALNAGCKQLVLTHFYPPYALSLYEREVEHYRSKIDLSFAFEHATFEIGIEMK